MFEFDEIQDDRRRILKIYNSAPFFATKCDRNMNNISFYMLSDTRKSILLLFSMKLIHKLQ